MLSTVTGLSGFNAPFSLDEADSASYQSAIQVVAMPPRRYPLVAIPKRAARHPNMRVFLKGVRTRPETCDRCRARPRSAGVCPNPY